MNVSTVAFNSGDKSGTVPFCLLGSVVLNICVGVVVVLNPFVPFLTVVTSSVVVLVSVSVLVVLVLMVVTLVLLALVESVVGCVDAFVVAVVGTDSVVVVALVIFVVAAEPEVDVGVACVALSHSDSTEMLTWVVPSSLTVE